MIRHTIVLVILISIIVASKENHNDIISLLVDGTQQKINITCLCTEDEDEQICDLNSGTCRITNPDHVCYESWTKQSNEDTIRVTAGYVDIHFIIYFILFYSFRCIYNEFLFTQILCNGNQSNHYIICCSDKNNCNDRDAFSSDIRKQLSLLSNF